MPTPLSTPSIIAGRNVHNKHNVYGNCIFCIFFFFFYLFIYLFFFFFFCTNKLSLFLV